MERPRVHVVGAGLAGLSAAVRLAHAGVAVDLYEAAGHAGGRCRSFHDDRLGRLIDNGNHLVLSGNRSALAYLEEIGARGSMTGPAHAVFPFMDLASGARWAVRINDGPVPLWVFDRACRVPETGLADYLGALRMAFAGPGRTVAEVVRPQGAMWTRFWEPLTVAALNCDPHQAAAALLGAVLRETFFKGGCACRPLVAREGLGPSLVEPALGTLARHGVTPAFNRRLRRLGFAGSRVAALDFAGGCVALGEDDIIVLALPPARAGELVPGLATPSESGVIVNAHFVVDRPVPAPGEAPFIGLVDGLAQWVFVRGDVVSVTVSAAAEVSGRKAEELLDRLWRESRIALRLGERPYRTGRIVKEKRATFDQSPGGIAKRSGPGTAFTNLLLAGDWTDTGLPATIESAVRSGHRAAAVALGRLGAGQ